MKGELSRKYLAFLMRVSIFFVLTHWPECYGQTEKYAIVIGVSGYPNFVSGEKLKYSDDDARLFSEFLMSPEGGSVKKDNIKLLLNRNATRINIFNAIQEINRVSSRYDDVYVFFAGHGVPSSSGEYYYMPFNADPRNPRALGIETVDFAESIAAIPHKRLLFFVDACHSGSSSAGVRGRNNNANNYIVKKWEELVEKEREVDMVLASSTTYEKAYESQRLKHGLFTYYLIKGLKGEANEDDDEIISAREIYFYISQNVTKAAKAEFNATQTPIVSSGWNPNTVLAVLPELSNLPSATKARNPALAQAKKEYIIGNFNEAINLAKKSLSDPESKSNPESYIVLGRAYMYLFIEDKTRLSLAQQSFDYFQKAISIGNTQLKEELMEDVILDSEHRRIGGGEGLMYLKNVLNIQGNNHFEASEYGESYKYFKLSSDISPDDIVMAFYVGYSAYAGELDNNLAIKYYKQVLRLNEQLPDGGKFENTNFVYNGLIDIYMSRLEDYDNALKYVREASKAFPEEELYREYEIDILIKAERMTEAIRSIKNSIALGDQTVFNYYRLAYLQWNNEEYEDALVSADKALAIDPNYYDALYVAGSILFNQGVEFLKSANNTDPSDNDGFDLFLKKAKQKFRQAMPYFEKAQEQKPDDMYSLNPLSTIYDQLKMIDKRDQVLLKISQLEKGN